MWPPPGCSRPSLSASERTSRSWSATRSWGWAAFSVTSCSMPTAASFASPPGSSAFSTYIVVSTFPAATKAGERPRLAPAPCAAALVLAAQPRPRAAPLWRPRLARSAAAAAATLLLGGWAFLSDDAYPLVARTLALKPIAHIPTDRPQVGLVLRAPAGLSSSLATTLRQRHAHASFAFTAGPDRQT